MSTLTQSPDRRSIRARLISAALLLLLLLVIGGIAWYLLVPSAVVPFPPFVQISSPQSGDMREINMPLSVQASAEGPDPFKRLELYADGALVAVEESTLEGGSTPLILLQSYTPLTLGRHVLMVRGYVRDDDFADSGVVYLDVVEASTTAQTINVDSIPISEGVLPSLNEISMANGVAPDRLQAANPALAGSDPNLPLPSGTTLVVPRRTAPSAPESKTMPVPLASAPAAPGALSLNLDCSSAQLKWDDTTSDETGFAVYRLAPADSQLVHVVTLPANATTYRDSLPGLGTYRYQVAALRAGKEGLSLMPSAATPDGCVPPPAKLKTVVLSVLSLETAEAYDGVYCYFDINGSGYQRLPEDDLLYFKPEADGLKYNLARQLPNHGQFVLAVPPGDGPVTLGGECWGRRGPIASAVGLPFKASYLKIDWDGHDLIQTALAPAGLTMAALSPAGEGMAGLMPADLRLTLRLSASTPAARRQAIASQFDLSRLDLDAIPAILDPPIPDPMHGEPGLLLIRNSVFIDEHSHLGCAQFGPNTMQVAFCEMQGWPTLTWSWEDDRNGYRETDLTEYRVELQITLPNGNMINGSSWRISRRAGEAQIPTFLLLPSRLPPNNLRCGSRYNLKLSVFTGTTLVDTASIFWMTTAPCGSRQPVVTITFTDLEVGRVADLGEQFEPIAAAPDDTLELEGRVGVGGSSVALVNSLAPSDFWWLEVNADTHYSMNDLHFVRDFSIPRQNVSSSFTIPIVLSGQTIAIWSTIYDVDPTFPGDLLHFGPESTCGSLFEIGPFTASQWSTINQSVTLGPSWPNAEECRIHVDIKGAVR